MGQVWFLEKTFLFTDISLEVILEMLFLSFRDVNV